MLPKLKAARTLSFAGSASVTGVSCNGTVSAVRTFAQMMLKPGQRCTQKWMASGRRMALACRHKSNTPLWRYTDISTDSQTSNSIRYMRKFSCRNWGACCQFPECMKGMFVLNLSCLDAIRYPSYCHSSLSATIHFTDTKNHVTHFTIKLIVWEVVLIAIHSVKVPDTLYKLCGI